MWSSKTLNNMLNASIRVQAQSDTCSDLSVLQLLELQCGHICVLDDFLSRLEDVKNSIPGSWM